MQKQKTLGWAFGQKLAVALVVALVALAMLPAAANAAVQTKGIVSSKITGDDIIGMSVEGYTLVRNDITYKDSDGDTASGYQYITYSTAGKKLYSKSRSATGIYVYSYILTEKGSALVMYDPTNYTYGLYTLKGGTIVSATYKSIRSIGDTGYVACLNSSGDVEVWSLSSKKKTQTVSASASYISIYSYDTDGDDEDDTYWMYAGGGYYEFGSSKFGSKQSSITTYDDYTASDGTTFSLDYTWDDDEDYITAVTLTKGSTTKTLASSTYTDSSNYTTIGEDVEVCGDWIYFSISTYTSGSLSDTTYYVYNYKGSKLFTKSVGTATSSYLDVIEVGSTNRYLVRTYTYNRSSSNGTTTRTYANAFALYKASGSVQKSLGSYTYTYDSSSESYSGSEVAEYYTSGNYCVIVTGTYSNNDIDEYTYRVYKGSTGKNIATFTADSAYGEYFESVTSSRYTIQDSETGVSTIYNASTDKSVEVLNGYIYLNTKYTGTPWGTLYRVTRYNNATGSTTRYIADAKLNKKTFSGNEMVAIDGYIQCGTANVYFVANSKGMYGAVNKKGTLIIPCSYTDIFTTGYSSSKYVLVQKSNGGWYVYNTANKKANTMKVTLTKKAKKGYSVSGKTTIKAKKLYKVKKAKGKVTYTRGTVKLSGKKVKGAQLKKIKVNKKTGKLTLKKGLKKGTYKVKVKVKAAGNSNYKAKTKTVTVKIVVK